MRDEGDEVRSSGTRATLVLTVATALLIAACSPVEGPAERPSDREPVVVDASLGVVRVMRGAPIVVRVVLDTRGDPEELAPLLEAAFRAAIEDFGAVQQGFRLDLGDVVATDCSRASGERVGRALAEDAAQVGIVGVLGPQCTETLLGLQGPATAAGLVVVTSRPQEATLTEVTGGSIGQDRAEGMWRTAPSLLQETRAAATYAAVTLEATRAAVAHDGSSASVMLADEFRSRFESLGGTVVLAREVDARMLDDDDVAEEARATLARELLDNDVDVIFLPVGPDEVLAVSTAMVGASRLADVTRIAISVAAAPEVLDEDVALGLVFTSPMSDFTDAVSSVTGMSASQTLERVRAESGVTDPAGWWAYAYDAATLLLKALEDASLIDVDGSFVLSRSELRGTLAVTRFGGLTGLIACTPSGDCAAGRTVVRGHDDPPASALVELPVLAVIED